MHVVTCTIARVLPVRDRVMLRAHRIEGGFPYWPEHLGSFVGFDVPAECDAADLWLAARRALLEQRREELPPLSTVSIRRLRGTLMLGRGVEFVVVGVWREKVPAFQLMVSADTCPTEFARPPTVTDRVAVRTA
jgi:hypothetical protein